MAIRLIAMDLDGTLLNSEKRLTPYTIDVLHRAQAAGVYTTIATGRMFLSAAYFGRLIAANAPLICCNGSVVQDIHAEEPLFCKKIPQEAVRRFMQYAVARDWYINWYIGNEIFVQDFREEYFHSYHTTEGFYVREVGMDYLRYSKDVIQCVVRERTGKIREIAAEIAREFEGEIDAQQVMTETVDLTPPGVTKAVGLSALAEHLGISPSEIMACGDADNDLAMLSYAGTSVVPENGFPEAKARATYHARSNDADGIAYAIDELVLAKKG